MVNRLVSVGDDFTLPDAVKVDDNNLPARLGAAALDATFATKAEAGTIQPGQRAWDIAVLNRENVGLNAVIIGDSHSRGVGASIVFDRMASRLEKMMQRTYNPSGVAGGYNILGVDKDVWTSGGGTPGVAPRGLGLESASLATGVWISHAARSATSFRVLFAQGPTSGPFTVSIDGAAATTVTPDATGVTRHDGLWKSGPLTRGTHTIRITGVGASAAEISSVYVHDQDETLGFHLYNASKGGTWLANHIDPVTAVTVWDRIAAIKPAMVVLASSFNEQTIQRSLADFRADLETAFTKITAINPNAWIPVVGMHSRIGETGAITGAQYRTVQREFAAAHPAQVSFHDLSANFPATQVADTFDLIGTDNSHLTSAGHALASDTLAREWALTSRNAVIVARPQATDALTLIADFNADTLTGADLSAVSTWAPAAGMETLPLVQTDTAKQPVLKVTGINGHKAVEFTDDALTVDWPSDWNTPLTLVYVGTRYRFDTGTMVSTANGQGVLTAGFSTSLGFTFGGGAVNEAAFAGINTTPLDGPLVIVAVYDGASSRFYINTLTARTGTVTPGKIGALRLGDNMLLNNPANPWTVTRVQAYGQALGNAECQSIISAHAATYALTLT